MDWSELVAASAIVVVTAAIFWKWTGRKSKQEDTPRPSSSQTKVQHHQPIAVHDIVGHENGNGNLDDEAYTNKAFQAEENPVTTQPQNVAKEQFVKRNSAKRQESLISNLSDVFRAPSADEKSLSELVIGEYDHKTKTLRKGESLDLSQFRTCDDEENLGSEVQAENDTFERDVNERLQSKQHTPNSLNRDNSHETVDQNEAAVAAPPEVVCQKTKDNKEKQNTEWRDKLQLELDEDEEEFLDESSEDEVSSNTCETDNGIESKTKGKAQNAETITSQTSVNKLLGERALVIDNGAYLVRGGWAGEFAPSTRVRNVIGHWRAEASEAWQDALGSKFIGEKALERHSTLALTYPMEGNKVSNWKSLQDVWNHVAVADMDTELVQQPVLITEPALVEDKQREKMVEVMIETLRVPGVCLRSQAAMCALSTGHKVGLVVNCGFGATEIVPMYREYDLSHSTATLGVGGRHLTDYLTRLVQREHGASFTSVAELEIMNTIKETYAKVQNEKSPPALDDNFEYELPDGQVIKLGKELSLCTEPLFNPGLVGNSSLGLPMLVKQTLDRLDPEIMKEGDNIILLAGGGSRLKGLQERLQDGLQEHMGGGNIVVQSTACQDNAAWIGGSLLAEQSSFAESCITEDIYFEHGSNAVHRFCW